MNRSEKNINLLLYPNRTISKSDTTFFRPMTSSCKHLGEHLAVVWKAPMVSFFVLKIINVILQPKISYCRTIYSLVHYTYSMLGDP